MFILLTKMWTKTRNMDQDQKCRPRPKLFLRLDIFLTFLDHITITYLRKSFIQIAKSNKHANNGIWIHPWPNTNDSTRSLSTGIENIHKITHLTIHSLRIPHYFVEIWTPLKPKNKMTLWLVQDTYPNAAIWLVQDTYPKQSDWCEQHATLCTLT